MLKASNVWPRGCGSTIPQMQAELRLPEGGSKLVIVAGEYLARFSESRVTHKARQVLCRLVGQQGTDFLSELAEILRANVGAAAGLISDKVSLGFVAATEHQVCKHLDEHLEQLPAEDEKSRAILEQMRIDEEHHAESALDAGGFRFPAPVRFGMSLLAKVMTKSTYRI